MSTNIGNCAIIPNPVFYGKREILNPMIYSRVKDIPNPLFYNEHEIRNHVFYGKREIPKPHVD